MVEGRGATDAGGQSLAKGEGEVDRGVDPRGEGEKGRKGPTATRPIKSLTISPSVSPHSGGGVLIL